MLGLAPPLAQIAELWQSLPFPPAPLAEDAMKQLCLCAAAATSFAVGRGRGLERKDWGPDSPPCPAPPHSLIMGA